MSKWALSFKLKHWTSDRVQYDILFLFYMKRNDINYLCQQEDMYILVILKKKWILVLKKMLYFIS